MARPRLGHDHVACAQTKIDVPVNVAANVLSGLEIRPHDQTISPGQQFTYQVSAMRGSNRVILTPADGVRLSVTVPR